MIIITGSVVARSDTLDAIRTLSLEHVARSRGEFGCLYHSVHVDCENPLRLVFIEHWRDRGSVIQHFAKAESRAFAAEMRRISASPPTIEIYEAEELPLSRLLAAPV